MMSKQNKSESLFESFCRANRLDWQPIPTGAEKTADYRLRFGATTVAFEIEQIESLAGFSRTSVSSRTVGNHVRHKIAEARKQLQSVAARGEPTILLIFNAVDPLQLFGTEQHDFICAMYGELTVHLSQDGTLGQPFHGRNAKLRSDINTSFSGVGHLRQQSAGVASVTVYENIYAAHPLPFGHFPSCIEVLRVNSIEGEQ